jgi:hypothetical protein
MVVYYDPISVFGSSMGRRQSIIAKVDSSRDVPLMLHNGDYLPRDVSVMRVKFVKDGTLHDNANAVFRRIEDYVLQDSVEDEFAQTGHTAYSRALTGMVSALRGACRRAAAEQNLPTDIVYGAGSGDSEGGSDTESVSTITNTGNNNACSAIALSKTLSPLIEGDETAEQSSVETNKLNFHAVVARGSDKRALFEEKGCNAQLKQASDVNRNRISRAGEVIGLRTVCHLEMPMDRNDFTPKYLPVMVCGHNYYKKTNTIRYR